MKRHSRLNEAKRNILRWYFPSQLCNHSNLKILLFLDHTNGVEFYAIVIRAHICPLNVILPLMHQRYYLIWIRVIVITWVNKYLLYETEKIYQRQKIKRLMLFLLAILFMTYLHKRSSYLWSSSLRRPNFIKFHILDLETYMCSRRLFKPRS